MERRKLTKEDIDKVRNIEGFPIGSDEDIIALSDAPFYTACPNPFIEDFIKEYGTPYDEATDDYHREPFAADVSEGKNDPIYMAHSYHTKVPYKAIMRYILHYTEPGDIIFDGFCGTGMTGVAAQMCAIPDPQFRVAIESKKNTVKWGVRKAIVSDISTAASFIAYNYNRHLDADAFYMDAQKMLKDVTHECQWMYETNHIINGEKQISITGEPIKGNITYTIWSDVLTCPNCSEEFTYWDVAVDLEKDTVLRKFHCPHCDSELVKRDCKRANTTIFDDVIGKSIIVAKQLPVSIHYTIGKQRFIKLPDKEDIALIEKINSMKIPHNIPVALLPEGDNTAQPKASHGVYYVHQFFTKRNLWACAAAYDYSKNNRTKFILTAIMKIMTKMYRYAPHGKCTAGMPGTLYLPSVTHEYSIFDVIKRRIGIYKDLVDAETQFGDNVIVSCNDLSHTTVPSNCIDYIFSDPPFGGNLNYSELNYIWESWLKVITNNSDEAIMNKTQKKGLYEYQSIMEKCFKEYFRVLKPGRWITIEFHNSQNSIWNAIQEGIQKAGFVVADVRTLDKKQASFKQTTTATAVKQDLVISAYKPRDSFRNDVFLHAGSEETAWAFIRQHLNNIPVVVMSGNKLEIVSERQAYLLFDRMVAYHIMQGIPVPLDATDFYRGLDEKFLKRDNMYFLPEQVNEYDTARIKSDVENVQFDLFVTNEKSAISWLYQQLDEKVCGPQTYAELQPKFMQEVKTVDKYEQMPELAVLLEENFLQDENGRWYIPDVTKEGDLLKLREKNLWKEFEGYMNSRGKLKLFRSEAIRVGFSRLWKEKNYKAIVDIAERLPEKIVQEDPNLLMYYDISLGRV
ncbi:DNA methyltransferase [Phascolarctobacterium succinatutens]|uniref:DNA methyltransferase n=1 Tax=Phascolarctobacterium succinatutens TaxID=626940 RepID=UPI003AF09C41